jgi:putative oxidoreductase
MTGSLNRYTHLVGRILLSLIFVATGLIKVTHWSATAGILAAKGIPLASVSLALATLLELCGGLLLIVGYRTRLVALLLSLYLIPVTLAFHNFWAYQDMQQQTQMVNFLKNLAILGGLLRLASDGAGAISVDAGRLRASAGAR